MFLEAGVEGASRFADVEFGAFGALSNVHDVVRLAVELFGLKSVLLISCVF